MFRDCFEGMLKNIFAVYTGTNLLWQGIACVITAVLVLSGSDWAYFEGTRSTMFFWVIMVAGVGGFFTPVLVPLGIYLYGEYRRSRRIMFLGAAAAQASVIAYFITVIYKAITGRTEPEFFTHLITTDYSRDFNFGILMYGIFWGWPSAHTAVAFAGAIAITLLTRSRTLQIVVLSGASVIAFGASVGFHWLSDVIAGLIIGVIVGRVVARSFSHKRS